MTAPTNCGEAHTIVSASRQVDRLNEAVTQYRSRLISRIGMAKASLASKIAELLDPNPVDADPEDFGLEAPHVTSGHAADIYGADSDLSDGSDLPGDREGTSLEHVKGYEGNVVSRSSLLASDDDDDETDGDENDDEVGGDDEDESDGDIDHEKKAVTFKPMSDDEDADINGEDDESDGEDESGSEDEDAAIRRRADVEHARLEEQLEELEKEDSALLFAEKSRSHASREFEKAQHVKRQAALWDSLVDLRIQTQQVIKVANRFPQRDHHATYVGESPNLKRRFNELSASSTHLIEDLFSLQHNLMSTRSQLSASSMHLIEDLFSLQHNLMSTRSQVSPHVSSDVANFPAKRRKLHDDAETETTDSDDSRADPTSSSGSKDKLDSLWEHISSVSEAFAPFQRSTLEQWHRKTRLATGGGAKELNSRQFKALDQSVNSQIDSILDDRDRLIKRSQIQRSSFRVFGGGTGKASSENEDSDQALSPEIFDDSDFYQQLLKDVVANAKKVSSTALSDYSQNNENLRKRKGGKNVDRKASKGRKIRYDVQEKLANFMAPAPSHSDFDSRELFSSLFNGVKVQR